MTRKEVLEHPNPPPGYATGMLFLVCALAVRRTVTATTPRFPRVKVALRVAKSARPREVGKGPVPQTCSNYSPDCVRDDLRRSEIQKFPWGACP